MRSSEEVVRMLESHLTPEKVFEEYTSVDILQIPGLPKTYLLESGKKLVLRNVRKDEDHFVYEIFAEAAEKGEGFSVHEFPSLNIMRLQMLASGYTAIIEEEDSNKLVGFIFCHDSALSRSGKGKVCDGSVIIREGFRGKGLGKVCKLMARFVRSGHGYEKVFRETFFNNSQVLNTFKDDVEFSICGILPRGGFQKTVGWVDLVLYVIEIDKEPNNHLQEFTKCRL